MIKPKIFEVYGEFCEQKGEQRGEQRGRQWGEQRGIEKVAETALLKGMPLETVREITGLSLKRIQELQAQIRES